MGTDQWDQGSGGGGVWGEEFGGGADTTSTEGGSPEKEPENKGTLTLDATCAPSHIRYPQDISLLNEGRGSFERMLGCQGATGGGPGKSTWHSLSAGSIRQRKCGERFKRCTGHYPERVLADQMYLLTRD